MAFAVKGGPKEFEALRKSCQDMLEEMSKCRDCYVGDEGDNRYWEYTSEDLNEIKFRLNQFRTGKLKP